MDVVEAGRGDDAGDGVGELACVRGGFTAAGLTLVRFEAGDVGDGAGAVRGPADTDAHPGADGVGSGCVEYVQECGAGPVEADEDPGEGGVERLVAARGGVPGPGGDGAGGGDLDEVAQFVRGDRVVLHGRHEDRSVVRADTEDGAFAQSGEEGALDGAEDRVKGIRPPAGR